MRVLRFFGKRLARTFRAARSEHEQNAVFERQDDRRKGTRKERKAYRDGLIVDNFRRLLEALDGRGEFRTTRTDPSKYYRTVDGVGGVPIALLNSWERRGWLGRDGRDYWIREEARAAIGDWDSEQDTTRDR